MVIKTGIIIKTSSLQCQQKLSFDKHNIVGQKPIPCADDSWRQPEIEIVVIWVCEKYRLVVLGDRFNTAGCREFR